MLPVTQSPSDLPDHTHSDVSTGSLSRQTAVTTPGLFQGALLKLSSEYPVPGSHTGPPVVETPGSSAARPPDSTTTAGPQSLPDTDTRTQPPTLTHTCSEDTGTS